MGYTQWAIADQMQAMVPLVTTANMYEALYPNGILSLSTALNWGLAVDSKTANTIKPEKMVAAYSILPLSLADDSTWAQNKFWDDWLKHEREDEYWNLINHRPLKATPMYSVAGWYDIFLPAQIKDFVSQGSLRHPESKLVIGPFAHGQILLETDWGEHGTFQRHEKNIFEFLSNQLNATSYQIQPEKPFSFFIIHKNEWIEAETWPPANVCPTRFYLNESGLLSQQWPEGEKVYEFAYDPLDPFPSLGGSFLGVGVGPALQNPNSKRNDQVVFQSEALVAPLVLLGPIEATVYFASDAFHTDLFVSLQEVRENGDIINIQEGGVKVNLTNNHPQKVDIPIWPTGYQINAGHKIRVAITSSLFPRYNRSLNTGEAIFHAFQYKTTRQKIYAGHEYPSSVSLPVYKEK